MSALMAGSELPERTWNGKSLIRINKILKNGGEGGFDFPPRPAGLSALRIALLHSLLRSSREFLRRKMSPAKRQGRPHHYECCAFLDLIEKSPRIAWERIEDLLTFLCGFWAGSVA
jgi:hypothetical protein